MVPWNGVGRTIWEAIRLTNNDVVYEVYGGFDRLLAVEDHVRDESEMDLDPVFGGIFVEDFDGTELAHLHCLPETVNYGY